MPGALLGGRTPTAALRASMARSADGSLGAQLRWSPWPLGRSLATERRRSVRSLTPPRSRPRPPAYAPSLLLFREADERHPPASVKSRSRVQSDRCYAVPRMTEERVAIVDLADDLKVRKQRLFKILQRLGIRSAQRREAARGNQNVATVSLQEAAAIRRELFKTGDSMPDGAPAPLGSAAPSLLSDEVGFFYLIELEPGHDPGRFKVGFTSELDGRLQKHRCSAPFARYTKTWPCRRGWERAAIDCVTDGCEQLHTEVFRAAALHGPISRGDAFFSVVPSLVSTIHPTGGDSSADEPANR